jgi:hypothetical protein
MESSSDFDEQKWAEVLRDLIPYAYVVIDHYYWYRGKASLPKGLEPKDLATDAVLWHLENPGKFSPSRGKLISFLKYSVLRRLISNLSSLDENTLTLDLENGERPYEECIPYNQAFIEESIDIDVFISIIESELSKDVDPNIWEIFYYLYSEEKQKGEICTNLGISGDEYNNKLKRMKRRIAGIISKLNMGESYG